MVDADSMALATLAEAIQLQIKFATPRARTSLPQIYREVRYWCTALFIYPLERWPADGRRSKRRA
jgi:hypothetical protein